jgi:hypothetical protein
VGTVKNRRNKRLYLVGKKGEDIMLVGTEINLTAQSQPKMNNTQILPSDEMVAAFVRAQKFRLSSHGNNLLMPQSPGYNISRADALALFLQTRAADVMLR